MVTTRVLATTLAITIALAGQSVSAKDADAIYFGGPIVTMIRDGDSVDRRLGKDLCRLKARRVAVNRAGRTEFDDTTFVKCCRMPPE